MLCSELVAAGFELATSAAEKAARSFRLSEWSNGEAVTKDLYFAVEEDDAGALHWSNVVAVVP